MEVMIRHKVVFIFTSDWASTDQFERPRQRTHFGFCMFFSMKGDDILLGEGFGFFAHRGCDGKQMILVNKHQRSILTNFVSVLNQVVRL